MLKKEDFKLFAHREIDAAVTYGDDLQRIKQEMINIFTKSLKFYLKKGDPHVTNMDDEVFWGMKKTMTMLGYDFTYKGKSVIGSSDVAEEILAELDERTQEELV